MLPPDVDASPVEPSPALPVVAIFGPTGAGKTAVAIALAERLRARGESPVAVSADALQVYRGLEILTGAADAAQRSRLEHRLLSFVPVDATFSVAEHAALAHAEIDGLVAAGRRPLVVGGSGLYLRAALADLDLRPPPPPGARERWEAEVARRGAPALHAHLSEQAPWAAARIDRNDRHRIIRALELLDAGALEPPSGPSALWTSRTRHPTVLVALVMDRTDLYAAIEARVDAMLAAGALDEVRAAHAAGASPTARKAVGFAELLAGDVDGMKRASRVLAKRQLTWMRKLPGAEIVDMTARDPRDAAREIAGLIAGRTARS